jgi:flagellar biosynthesis protein FlhG
LGPEVIVEPDRNEARHEAGFLKRWFRRRPPASSPRGEGVVVAFASGKGGTGKSFLATNAAIALHDAGRRVVVVDCDFGLANAHLLFGVNPRWSLQHLLAGGVSIQQVMERTPHGPWLVAGGSGIAGLAGLEAPHLQVIARALHQLAATHDVVLLDCAAGLAPQSLVMVLAAQEVVIVTNPEIAALTDAYALVKCLARQDARPEVGLVVNRVTRSGLGQTTYERLADVARRFAACSIHYLGEVPEDPQVTHRRLDQPPLLRSLPQCATTRAVREVVATLEARLRPLQEAATAGIEARMLAQLRRW